MSRNVDIIDELQAQADTAAFGARIGIDLTSEFATAGERNLRLDNAGLRAGVDGTQNIVTASLNGDSLNSKENKQEQNFRTFSQAIATSELLDQMIDDINWQIAEIDTRIGEIDVRLAEINTERQIIGQQRSDEVEEHGDIKEITEEQEIVVQGTQADCGSTALANQRAILDVIRADSPEALIEATQRETLTREEAEAAVQIHLKETATLKGYENQLSELNERIANYDTRLEDLTEEEIRLYEERDDLTMDKEQLITMRDRLEDPELRAAIERGEITNEDILKMMPEELQANIMESLTARFQSGWEYTQELASGAVNAIISTFDSALEIVGLGGVFTSSASDDLTPNIPSPEATPVIANAAPKALETPQQPVNAFQPS